MHWNNHIQAIHPSAPPRVHTHSHMFHNLAPLCFAPLLLSGLSHVYGQASDLPMPDDTSYSITAKELVSPRATRKPHNPLAAFLAIPEINQVISVPETPSHDYKDYPRFVVTSQNSQIFLQAFDHLVNQTRPEDWYWPELGIGPASDWTTGSPAAVRKALQAVNLCAISAMLSGDQDQALATFTSLAKFSEIIQRRPCGLAHLVISTTSLRMSEAQLERTLVLRHLGPKRLSRLQQALTISELGVSDIRESLRIDYTQFKESLPHLAAEVDISEYEENAPPMPGDLRRLNPGATCSLRLEHDQTLLVALGKNWKEGLLAAATLRKEFIQSTQSRPQHQQYDNPLGEYHHRQHFNKMQVLLDEFAQCITAHRLTLLQIAIRRYELDHDKLPARLDELVPKYLPAVPTDPFANAPMRWDPTKQALYSVGLDFTDNGGAFWRPAAPIEADMGMLYWWGEPGGRRRHTPSNTDICPVERK